MRSLGQRAVLILMAVILAVLWLAGTQSEPGFGWRAALLFAGAYLVICVPVVLVVYRVLGPLAYAADRTVQRYAISRECPYCREVVHPEATICRYCGNQLTPPSPTSTNPSSR